MNDVKASPPRQPRSSGALRTGNAPLLAAGGAGSDFPKASSVFQRLRNLSRSQSDGQASSVSSQWRQSQTPQGTNMPSLSLAAIVKLKLAAAKLKPDVADSSEEERFLNATAMPVPGSYRAIFDGGAPEDATWLETVRDWVLGIFVHPTMNGIFLYVALVVVLCIVSNGLIIAYTILGLFLNVDNGWDEVAPTCIACAAQKNLTLTNMMVPECPNLKTPNFCTINQEIFNLCIKTFVVLFSYINVLPIPWRLSIAHHVFCSHRSSEAGLDFCTHRHTRGAHLHAARLPAWGARSPDCGALTPACGAHSPELRCGIQRVRGLHQV